LRLTASRILKGSVVVTASSIIIFALRFARNIILAHILIKFDYGACVALTTVVTSAQLLTDFGFDKMLIQERSAPIDRLQPVLTALNIVRATFTGLLLLALARPLSDMFGAPNAMGAFALLALGVFLQGLFHLDLIRVQRDHQFAPIAYQNLTVALVDFVVVLVWAYLFHGYFAVPVAYMASTAGGLIVSQLLAERRLSVRWNADIVKRAWQFGSPLVLSGIIILLASQADRILVGASLGLPMLAVYGAAMTIIATPTSFVSNVAITVLLPALSEAASDDVQFTQRFRYVGIIVTFIAGMIFMPVMFLGKPVIARAFGVAYSPSLELVWIIGLGQAAALVRVWPNLGALALGETKNLIVSNIPRAIGVAIALLATHLNLGLLGIAVSFAFGEVVSLVSALWHLRHRRPQLLLGSFLLFAILYTGILLAAETSYQVEGEVLVAVAASFAFNCLLGVVFLLVSADTRRVLKTAMARIARRKPEATG
jgi:O-antigen/teichoic acid export membrane protein